MPDLLIKGRVDLNRDSCLEIVRIGQLSGSNIFNVEIPFHLFIESETTSVIGKLINFYLPGEIGSGPS